MRCRRVALVLLVGLVATTVGPSPAAAHPAQPPWEASFSLQGEPRTGVSTELAVTLTANGDLEERTFELELPDHVMNDGDTRWQVDLDAGETRTRSWAVWTDEPGFWTARLAETNGTFEGPGCCLYAYSGPQEGLSGPQPEDAIPEPEATTATSFAARGHRTVEVTYTVRRGADWMRHGAFQLRHSLGGEEAESRAERGEAQAQHAFEVPLADGEQITVFVASHLRVGFEGPEGEGGEHFAFVHCRNLQLERTGDEVRRAGDWGCEARRARGGQPTHPPEEDASTPGPGAAAIAASLALAAAATRWR